MSNSNTLPKAGFLAQLSWLITYKFRKTVICILLIVIFSVTVFLYYKYQRMETNLAKLKKFEITYVLKSKTDLAIGEKIKFNDLIIGKLLKDEINQANYFTCQNIDDFSTCPNLFGRILKIPVFKNTVIREEYLAPKGTRANLTHLLQEGEVLIDIQVAQTGFNVHLKPNDHIDLYKVEKTNSKLISENARIIMIDSQTIGMAPMQVQAQSKLRRNLSLAIKSSDFKKIAPAIKANQIQISLHRKLPNIEIIKKNPSKQVLSHFQQLTMIQGNKKEFTK